MKPPDFVEIQPFVTKPSIVNMVASRQTRDLSVIALLVRL